MIITCEQCQAQFQLPDERIPAKGARVRCSKCKHAFFVAHPGSSAPAPSEDASRSTAGQPAAPTTPAQPAAQKSPLATPSIAQSTSTANSGREDEVGDWGFNEDVKAKSGSFGKAKAFAEANLFEEPSPDLSRAPTPQEETSPFENSGESSLSSELSSEEREQSFTAEEEPGGDFSDLFSANSEDQTPAASAKPEQASSDGLGNFDDWDFFGEGKAKDTSSVVPPAGTEDFFDSLGTADQKPPLPNAAPVVVAPIKKAPPPLPPWFDFASTIAGWSVVAIMILVIAFESMTPAETFVAPKEGALKIGALAADGVRGRMIENAVSGMVYVVSGQLRNDSNVPAAAGTALRVVLIDERGNAIANMAAAMAGFALPDYQLREEKADELQNRLETSSAQLAWTKLASKETLQFDALFASMPSDAVGFRIETVDVAKPRINAESPGSAAANESHESVTEDTSEASPAALELPSGDGSNAQQPSSESVETPTEQDASAANSDSASASTPEQDPPAESPAP